MGGCHARCDPDPPARDGWRRDPSGSESLSPLKIKNWEQGESIVPRTGIMGSPSSTTTRAEEQREREKDSGSRGGTGDVSERLLGPGPVRRSTTSCSWVPQDTFYPYNKFPFFLRGGVVLLKNEKQNKQKRIRARKLLAFPGCSMSQSNAAAPRPVSFRI